MDGAGEQLVAAADDDFGAGLENEDDDEAGEDEDPPCPPEIVDTVGRGRLIGGWAKCAYNCGPPHRQHWFCRSNPRGFWICRECHNAARCLRGQCKTPEAKQSLKEYPVRDPEGWAARVRACRIDPKRGLVVDNRGRMIEVLRQVTAMTQRIIMRDLAGVEWLDRAEWQWEQERRGKTKEEAGEEWDRIIATPGDKRRPGP